MTFNKITRTLIPPIFGYLAFLLCDGLFEKFFPIKPDDLFTPGIIILLEYLAMVVWTIIVFTFQYKVIVPKTLNSIRRAITLTIILGLVISLFTAFMNYTADNAAFKEVTITFFRVLIQVESFILSNLVLIAIFNKLTNKREK